MADSAPALLYVTNHSTQHCNTAAAFLTQNPVDQQLGGGNSAGGSFAGLTLQRPSFGIPDDIAWSETASLAGGGAGNWLGHAHLAAQRGFPT